MTSAQVLLLLVLVVLFATGAAVLVRRLLRARDTGFSIRMQVFFVLTVTSIALAVSFIVLLLSPAELAAAEPSDATIRLGYSVLLLAAAAAVASVFIGRFVAQPLERLTHAAQRIAAGERQATLPIPRGREVRALTTAFEHMRAQLEERHAVERFVADLSHELKNPIAAIRASSEVLSDAIDHDPESARRFLRRIDEAASRLDHLTADLLTLARLEAQGLGGVDTVLDLSDVIEKAISAQRATADTRGVDLAVELRGAATIRGDALALRRALENLLDNAIRYAPAGSRVVVQTEHTRAELAVLVTDYGPGVDPHIAPRVFERFTTLRQNEGGTGLGLAIVRAVAESHGGRAELRPATAEGGTTFAVVLPGL